MTKPSMDLIAEINALQRMDAAKLQECYGEILADMRTCRKCELLRAEIAYRLQERYYGISLPEKIRKQLADNASEVQSKPSIPLSGTRLIRNWKGVDHEVIIRNDGVIEYKNGLYRSLSAVAKKITGTNWNGRTFFGIKK